MPKPISVYTNGNYQIDSSHKGILDAEAFELYCELNNHTTELFDMVDSAIESAVGSGDSIIVLTLDYEEDSFRETFLGTQLSFRIYVPKINSDEEIDDPSNIYLSGRVGEIYLERNATRELEWEVINAACKEYMEFLAEQYRNADYYVQTAYSNKNTGMRIVISWKYGSEGLIDSVYNDISDDDEKFNIMVADVLSQIYDNTEVVDYDRHLVWFTHCYINNIEKISVRIAYNRNQGVFSSDALVIDFKNIRQKLKCADLFYTLPSNDLSNQVFIAAMTHYIEEALLGQVINVDVKENRDNLTLEFYTNFDSSKFDFSLLYYNVINHRLNTIGDDLERISGKTLENLRNESLRGEKRNIWLDCSEENVFETLYAIPRPENLDVFWFSDDFEYEMKDYAINNNMMATITREYVSDFRGIYSKDFYVI